MARKSPTRPRAPAECPVCGEGLQRGAMACPECGADHNSGWKQDADDAGSLGLPDDDFRYDDWVQQEFGNSPKPAAIKPLWWLIAILLLVVLAVLWLEALSK